MAFAALAASLAGAGISAYSSYQQGQAQQDMAQHNAQIASNAARNEAETAAENAARQREANRRQLGAIRARMAGGGTQIASGSSLDVLGVAASELELQAMDLFRDSDAKQRQYRNEAQIQTWQGGQAAQAGNIGAIGSLLGGLGSTYSSYASGTYAGVFRAGA